MAVPITPEIKTATASATPRAHATTCQMPNGVQTYAIAGVRRSTGWEVCLLQFKEVRRLGVRHT